MIRFVCAVVLLGLTATAWAQENTCTAAEIAREQETANAVGDQFGTPCDNTTLHCIFFKCICLQQGMCGHVLQSGGGSDDIGEADTSTDAPSQPDIGEAETNAPTPSPSSAPSSSSSTATPQSCHRNCGQVENGGGTCDPQNETFCTSCNDGMLLTSSLGNSVDDHIKGNCISRITCDRRVIVGGRFNSERCTPCLDRHCFKCVITHPSGSPGPTEECQRCRDGFYLSANGTCTEGCDPDKTLSGANMFGRRCMDPFTCRSNRVMNYSDSRGCKCPNSENTRMDSNCHTCDFNAGEFGQRCTKCRNRKYLYNDTCYDNCNAFPELVQYTHGNYGSMCREPFTCVNGADNNGQACKCKSVSSGCRSCSFGLNGNVCLD